MTDEHLPERDKETYIGDGLYASFDGWCVWLRAPRENGDHRIALEPGVWRSLRAWIDSYPDLKLHMDGYTHRHHGGDK